VTRRSVAAWGGGGGVLLSAISAALINELHAGWPWVVGAAVAVLVWAAATVLLAYQADRRDDLIQAAGSVMAGRDIRGDVSTTTRGLDATRLDAPGSPGRLGPGAVHANRDIWGSVSTHATTVAATAAGEREAESQP